ncbi:uncharacterized protein LOC119405194 isoform X1 [Rhipicephalus sanguineus]|uniref:uncharacterized protein LOC119405194 isoform X1 n=1 Tax=Rhipicephalus sanguineus TaxID=34632 RepID=UPI001895BC61|nr:uncharacterized protein LOC119405194 isoform X1 [Rhipicephalus sanguineus]XP_049275186.1 uncharacterized protein LOC119405194 isoform X1 [Rhipicephalus sanguineus]
MSSHFSPRQNFESTASRNDNMPKMSVLAQFDDFCRRVATDDDEVLYAMLDFVRNQEVCRQRWEAAEKCCNRLAEDNESLVLMNSELQAKLRYTRDVLEKEVQRRLKCEAHLRALQAQLDQIRYCVFGQGFQNREHHMVTVLKNVLSQDNFESAMADKSVQSVLSPTGTTLSSGAHHSGETASRDISGEAHHMLLGMPAIQSPLPAAGTRQLSSGQALSAAALSESVSYKPVPPGTVYSAAAASVPTKPALPRTVPVVQFPSSAVSSGSDTPRHSLPKSVPVALIPSRAIPSEAVTSGAVAPGPAPSGSVPMAPDPSRAVHSRAVYSGTALSGSAAAGSSGTLQSVPGPPKAVPSGAATSRAVSSGSLTPGLALHGSVPTAPVPPGFIPSETVTSSSVSSEAASSSVHVAPSARSFKLVPPPPLYSVSTGQVLSGSVPSGPVSSEAASSTGHVRATAALHANSVNARSIHTESVRTRIVTAGAADPVPLPWIPGGTAATGPDRCGSVPARSPGPPRSKRAVAAAAAAAAAEQSSPGLGPAPAKVHFELSDSRKTSVCNSSCETGGRGEVFATTMTVVAGEPGYVATVTSQMESSIGGSSSSSQQRFRRSRSGPALLVRHSSQKATEKAASVVPPSSSSLDESGVEEECGFVSRLERMGPLNRSTPLPEASQQQQQSHTFVSRPAVNPENCIACNKRIRFYKASYQCGACGVVCHPECKSLVPLPCGLRAPPREARGASGGAAARSGAGVLADYAPSEPPFVTPLVVHCIREVERRCLQERGPLYGSVAPPEEVDTLLGRLLSGHDLPILSDHSLPVVCGALMKFLATLRETVITKAVWPLLAEAAVTGDEDKENRVWKFLDATCQLPAANRAVLSMLLVHLRCVSTTSLGGDGRSLDELAAVFAPVVVGCSTSSPSAEVQERDRPLQDLIMHCLLGVPDVYWKDNAAAGSYEPVQQETRPGTSAEDCCVSRWKEVVKRKLKRSIGVGSLEPGNKK